MLDIAQVLTEPSDDSSSKQAKSTPLEMDPGPTTDPTPTKMAAAATTTRRRRGRGGRGRGRGRSGRGSGRGSELASADETPREGAGRGQLRPRPSLRQVTGGLATVPESTQEVETDDSDKNAMDTTEDENTAHKLEELPTEVEVVPHDGTEVAPTDTEKEKASGSPVPMDIDQQVETPQGTEQQEHQQRPQDEEATIFDSEGEESELDYTECPTILQYPQGLVWYSKFSIDEDIPEDTWVSDRVGRQQTLRDINPVLTKAFQPNEAPHPVPRTLTKDTEIGEWKGRFDPSRHNPIDVLLQMPRSKWAKFCDGHVNTLSMSMYFFRRLVRQCARHRLKDTDIQWILSSQLAHDLVVNLGDDCNYTQEHLRLLVLDQCLFLLNIDPGPLSSLEVRQSLQSTRRAARHQINLYRIRQIQGVKDENEGEAITTTVSSSSSASRTRPRDDSSQSTSTGTKKRATADTEDSSPKQKQTASKSKAKPQDSSPRLPKKRTKPSSSSTDKSPTPTPTGTSKAKHGKRVNVEKAAKTGTKQKGLNNTGWTVVGRNGERRATSPKVVVKRRKANTKAHRRATAVTMTGISYDGTRPTMIRARQVKIIQLDSKMTADEFDFRDSEYSHLRNLRPNQHFFELPILKPHTCNPVVKFKNATAWPMMTDTFPALIQEGIFRTATDAQYRKLDNVQDIWGNTTSPLLCYAVSRWLVACYRKLGKEPCVKCGKLLRAKQGKRLRCCDFCGVSCAQCGELKHELCLTQAQSSTIQSHSAQVEQGLTGLSRGTLHLIIIMLRSILTQIPSLGGCFLKSLRGSRYGQSTMPKKDFQTRFRKIDRKALTKHFDRQKPRQITLDFCKGKSLAKDHCVFMERVTAFAKGNIVNGKIREHEYFNRSIACEVLLEFNMRTQSASLAHALKTLPLASGNYLWCTADEQQFQDLVSQVAETKCATPWLTCTSANMTADNFSESMPRWLKDGINHWNRPTYAQAASEEDRKRIREGKASDSTPKNRTPRQPRQSRPRTSAAGKGSTGTKDPDQSKGKSKKSPSPAAAAKTNRQTNRQRPRRRNTPKVPKAAAAVKPTAAPNQQSPIQIQQDSKKTKGQHTQQTHAAVVKSEEARQQPVPAPKDKPSLHRPSNRGKMARCASCQWYVVVCSDCERAMCPDHPLPRQCVFDSAFAVDSTFNSNPNQRHRRYAEVLCKLESADSNVQNTTQQRHQQAPATQQLPAQQTATVTTSQTLAAEATRGPVIDLVHPKTKAPTATVNTRGVQANRQETPSAMKRKQKKSSLRATAVVPPKTTPEQEAKAPKPGNVSSVENSRFPSIPVRRKVTKHYWSKFQSNCSVCGAQTMDHCVRCRWSFCTGCRQHDGECNGGNNEPSPPQHLRVKMENYMAYQRKTVLEPGPVFMDLTGEKSSSDTDVETPDPEPRAEVQQERQPTIPNLESSATPPPSPSSMSSLSLDSDDETKYQAEIRRKAWRSNLLGVQKAIIQSQQELSEAILQLTTLQSQQLAEEIRRDERFERAKGRKTEEEIAKMVERWQQTSRVAKYEYMRKIKEVQKKINKIQTRLSVLMEEVDALNKDDRLGD